MATRHAVARAALALAVVSTSAATTAAQPKLPRWKDKIKAEILCGVVKDGEIATIVPTADKRKLAEPISCAVHLDQNSKPGETWSVHVFVEDGDPESHPSHDGEVTRAGTDAEDFELQLAPSTDSDRQDFWPCRTFSIRAMISNDAGPLWMKDLLVEQRCPVVHEPPANAASLHWTENALSRLSDDDARAAAIDWAAAYERNDDEWFRTHFPKTGMAIPGNGKLTWKGLQNAGAQPQDIFQIVPGGECKDEETRADCAWGEWETIAKGKKEFWLYNASQSGYGAFPAVVYKKVGKAWAWKAMKVYDTGEP